MPKTTRKRRSAAAPIIEADPVVGSEPVDTGSVESDPGPNDLGQAIDWVRRALTPFDDSMRKRIIRAANVMMK